MQTWVDVANVVTAVMAVAGVAVAAWLGCQALKLAEKSNRAAAEANVISAAANETASKVLLEEGRAIQEALRANNNIERQFLFSMVSGLVGATFEFVRLIESCASSGDPEGGAQIGDVRKASERLRLEVSLANEFFGKREAPDALNVLAMLREPLVWVVDAGLVWSGAGRAHLGDFVMDASDEVTRSVLDVLKKALFGQPYFDDSGEHYDIAPAADRALDGSGDAAQKLRKNLAVSEWVPTEAEACRILYVWALAEWGEIGVQLDDEDQPVGLRRLVDDWRGEFDEESDTLPDVLYYEEWIRAWVEGLRGDQPIDNDPADVTAMLSNMQRNLQKDLLAAAVRVLRMPDVVR